MRIISPIGALIILTLLLVACGSEPEPTPTPLPTNTPSPTPTLTPTPTATPSPTPTPRTVTGPTSASNIPFPTATITPTPDPSVSPTPTPNPGPDILVTSRGAMAETVTFALEIDIVLDVRSGGLAIEVPVNYAGDVHNFGYSAADLTVTIPFQVFETKIITGSYRSYIFDNAANTWSPLTLDSPFFAGPSVFLGTDPGATNNVVLVKSETIDGVETHVVSATRPGVEIGGATGDLDVVYWIGVDDGLLRKVEANGAVEFGEQGIPGLDFSIAAANATLTARFFDYGKTVEIITPELVAPRIQHDAGLLDDGRVFVTGGQTGFANNDTIVPFPFGFAQIYDPDTGLWHLEDPISQIEDGLRLLHSAVKLQDGRVLSVGLVAADEDLASSAEVFDPALDSWTSLPAPPTTRAVPNVVLLADGRVLVTGGLEFDLTSAFGQPPSLGETEIFDPETGEWQQTAAMSQPAEGQAAILLSDGRVLVVGGTLNNREETNRAEIYDPETDSWIIAEPMSAGRDRPVAVLLSDGRVLVTEDGPFASSSTLTFGAAKGTAEIYDPDTGKWTPTADLSRPRTGHTLTLLPDGRVLAAGGEDPTGDDYVVYSTTEIFDPATNSWSPGPDLSKPRGDHTATLMPDGRVLLIGGIGQEDERYLLLSSEFVSP